MAKLFLGGEKKTLKVFLGLFSFFFFLFSFYYRINYCF